ncbi:MAG: hypothetical protein GEU96_10260 [Propionibacteriales bacterium]|nr:hypothetical protein [Propionibacteriales bacterium]
MSAGAAFAHGYGESIGGEDIRNESIYSQDIKDGEVKPGEIADYVEAQFGAQGYEADGLYKQLTASEEVQAVYAECAEGKVAVGGGFSPEDGFTHEGVTVIASRPSVADGHFTVIEGDAEGSVRSTAWELWFVNESGDPRNVRPWVVCAEVG